MIISYIRKYKELWGHARRRKGRQLSCLIRFGQLLQSDIDSYDFLSLFILQNSDHLQSDLR